MDLISTIGRDLPNNTSEYDIDVSEDFERVSRQHATIHWHGINNGKEGVVILEDHDTPNGTFVNGRRYAKVRLSETDKVRLGGNTKDDYQLDLKSLYAAFRKTELKERTDFSEEFEQLKQVSVDYHKEKQKLIKVKGWKQRLMMYGVPTFVSTILGMLVTDDKKYRALFLMAGFVIGIIVDFLFGKDDRDRIERLRLKFQPRYCCPKCGQKFNLESTHWMQLEAEGCPKCDAKFKKPEANE